MSAARASRGVACLIVVVYAGCAIAAVWMEIRLGLRFAVEDALMVAGFGAFAVVGALIVAARPGNFIGWILVAVSLVVPVHAGDLYAALVMTTRGSPDALAVFASWVNMWYWYVTLALFLVFLPLLFPDGRLPSRRWVPVAVMTGLAVVVIVGISAVSEKLTGTDVAYQIPNPVGIAGMTAIEDMPVFGTLSFMILGLGVFGAFASIVVRYRLAASVERQQLKWFLYACALLPLNILLENAPEILGNIVFGAIIIALPTSIGLAVFRYRLYDIDSLINRTLVYGTLTAMLVGVYIGSVVSLQYVFRVFMGGESQIVVVASTLAIAALFNPLRRRIQSFVDRRFYRSRYDARKTLESFSARLRDETDLETLSNDLATVARSTLHPTHVSLWLRTSEREERVG